MPNMSYCRFENTVSDIRDCMAALDEHNYNLNELIKTASSRYEARAMKEFVELCKEIAANFEDGDDEENFKEDY